MVPVWSTVSPWLYQSRAVAQCRPETDTARVILWALGKTSKFITAGCSQNAAAFKSNVLHFLYKLAAAGCSIWRPQPINFDVCPYQSEACT